MILNIQAYINSGILQGYCLGIISVTERLEVEQLCRQYPTIKNALENVEKSFGQFFRNNAVQPPVGLKQVVLATIENLEQEKKIHLSHPPRINQFSNHQSWMQAVAPLIPPTISEPRVVKVLYQSPQLIQMLVISTTDIGEEVHNDLQESFLVLHGECECIFGTDIFKLTAGGFAQVPLHINHHVKIMSPYVIAILQRVAV